MGPITILYVRRSLAEGWLSGLVTALGAATADAMFAAVAAFGLTALASLLISLEVPVRIVGGLFLLYIGIKTIRAVPVERAAAADGADTNLWRHYFSTVFLTLTNPLTILVFAGVFTGAGLALSAGGESCPLVIVLGVFGGSILWAGGLATIAAFLGRRFELTPSVMRWINRASGALISLFALGILWGLASAIIA